MYVDARPVAAAVDDLAEVRPAERWGRDDTMLDAFLGLAIERERLLREREEAHADERDLRKANERSNDYLASRAYHTSTPSQT